MSGDTPPVRQYTDREVQLILKSAVELQQRSDGIAVAAGLLGTGYVAARKGLADAVTRYRERASVLIDVLVNRASR